MAVADGVTINQASALLGVPAPTLRSWERRYGLPSTPRSPGGHRRYSEETLHQLRLMRDAVAQGRRAAEAARSVLTLLDRAHPALDRVEDLLSASRRLDPAAVRAVLDRARDELGLADALDQVLMPTMRQIGTLWESGRCDVAEEHLTTEAARGWLARITTLAAPPAVEGPVLLACGPRDLHTLGLEALAALLAHRGIGARVLGARTPARTLVTAVTATSAAAVVVVSHLPTQRRPAVEALHAAARTGCPTFYAGNAFAGPGNRREVPGTYLGSGLAAAADLLSEVLGER